LFLFYIPSNRGANVDPLFTFQLPEMKKIK
jgi:hypothetical protein